MRALRVAQEAVRALEASIRAATTVAGRSGAVAPPQQGDAEQLGEVQERALLISLKPHFADAILDGRKTVELRRTRPNLPDGSLVLLYSSTPTRAVVGWAQLVGVREGTPTSIWVEFGAEAAIEEVDYEAYFDGTDLAFALELDDVVAARRLIPLSVIRSLGIQPPQSWRYVPAAVTTQIQESAIVSLD